MTTDGNGEGEPPDPTETAAAVYKAMRALAESQQVVVNLHGGLLAMVLALTRRVEEFESERRPS